MDHTPSSRQRAFFRYLTATLVDLAVLNLCIEYWREYVAADSFTITLVAAVLLQILLKLTIVLERRVSAFFNARPLGFSKFMRFFTAWLIPVRVEVRHSPKRWRWPSATACVSAAPSTGSCPDRGRCRVARGRGGPRVDLPPHGLRERDG
jgi:hypothetical protein